MKIYNSIGSKERFLEVFQGVNKIKLNELSTNVLQTGTQLVEKAFDELKNKVANVKQTNTQTVGDDNFIEIITTDNEGNEITFTFKVNSTEGDQDGVYNVNNAILSKFKISSSSLNVDMPENMKSIQEFNDNRGNEIMDVVSEYANFETNTSSSDDELYQEAVKLIDKVPYKKGTEEMQTNKAYGDEKPTNPEVRVDAIELDKFVSEVQDYVEDDYTQTTDDEDPLALPPEYNAADLPNNDDDGTIGVDPYDTIDDEQPMEQVSPEKADFIGKVYSDLIQAGNPSPTVEEVMNEINRLQGNIKPMKKTRTIPKGAEAFYEGESIVNTTSENKKNYITQADDILTKRLGAQKLQMSKQEYAIMVKDLATKIYHIGMRGMNEEAEMGDYPDSIGKKFKPKNQMPKKKKKPQSVVKLSESTDEDKYEDVVFMQGEEAEEPLEILRNQGEEAALKYLIQWHQPGSHMGKAEHGHGSSDQTYEKDGYLMSWNFPLNYIGLEFDLSQINEEDDKWIQKAVNPEHKGYCTPMTKDTCTPPRKALAKRFKKGIDETEEDIEQVEKEKINVGDELDGGLADDNSPKDFDAEQLAIGLKVEMEHTNDPLIAIEIAMDHLKEIPDYYTRLDQMEKDAKSETGDENGVESNDELTDELLGYKPHNVSDYAAEGFDYAAAERDYEDAEDMRQHPEDYEDEKHPLADVLDSEGGEKDLTKQNNNKGINRALKEDDNMEEYQGDIGDRYQDAQGNDFTVRNKTQGGVTLQGQGGEKEIATRDISFLKKMNEEKNVEKEIISEERIKIARQALNKRGVAKGMTKKEAVEILIKHNIR